METAFGLFLSLVLVATAGALLPVVLLGKGHGGNGVCRGCGLLIEVGHDWCPGCIGGEG